MKTAHAKDVRFPVRRKTRRQRISLFDYVLALGSMTLVMGGLLGAAFYALN